MVIIIQHEGFETGVPYFWRGMKENFRMHARRRVYLFTHSSTITGCLCGVESCRAGQRARNILQLKDENLFP